MIDRMVSVTIKVTPYEAEAELWNTDTLGQAEFMRALAQRYQANSHYMLMRMRDISKGMNMLLTPEEREAIAHVIERLLEYIKKEDEDEYELIDCGNGCYEKVFKRKEGEI